MNKALGFLMFLSSFSVFAQDIRCSIPGTENEILITENSMIVTTPLKEVTYPRVIANKTYPEIGVVTGFKGTYRRAGSSADYSVLTLRVDGVIDGVAFGSISMSGRDRSLNLQNQKLACDESIVQLFE
jgi:hypothetical protein